MLSSLAGLYYTRRKQKIARDKHPSSHQAIMGRLKIAPFATRDDARVAQLGPAGAESGSYQAMAGPKEF